MTELISRSLAAEILRKLADRLEVDAKIRITNLEHQDWDSLRKEQVTIKWERAL